MIAIAGITLHQQIYSRSWHEPLDIIIYPINADSSPETDTYIDSLSDKTFVEIDDWIAREAKRYQLPQSRPMRTRLGAKVKSVPPALPVNKGVFRTVLWGLHMRWWVLRNTPDDESNLRRVRVLSLIHI